MFYSGDSGYPLRPWLITPYRSPNEEERRFNTAHAKARNCVERLNGVIKGIFRCLKVGLNTTPQTAGKIINACTVLHNFRLEHGIFFEENTEDIDYIVPIQTIENTEPMREASRIRDRLKRRICN